MDDKKHFAGDGALLLELIAHNASGMPLQQICSQGGGHFPQLHDLPPGADGFLCLAEESDCTSVFSTLNYTI
jgi:hypothetical protein